MRLFCLPYAGGGANVYAGWAREFPEELEVCLVEPPGRRGRLREPAFTRVGPLVDALDAALQPYLDLPYAFFGHSFGALLAYELHHRLDPAALFLSGAAAPHLPRAGGSITGLPDRAFLDQVRGYGGIPDAVFADESMMAAFLPALRADFEAFEAYRPAAPEPVRCPLFLLGGAEDHVAPPAQVDAWRRLAAGPVQSRFFAGGHFYLNEQRRPLTAHVARHLGAQLYRRPAPARG